MTMQRAFHRLQPPDEPPRSGETRIRGSLHGMVAFILCAFNTLVVALIL